MSDDDWGDDDAWDDAGGDGGGDDDWGDDGEDAGDDGWGDEAGGDADEEEEEMSLEVQIENGFYEADDTRLDDGKLALTQFEKVVELGEQHAAELEDQSMEFVFKSLKNIVLLRLGFGQKDEMIASYEKLLNNIPRVTRNVSEEAVKRVLNEVGDGNDSDFIGRVYALTAKHLGGKADQDRLLFRVNFKHCELMFARGEYKEAEQQLQVLLRSCQTPDGEDDLSKGAELLEIYALAVQISVATKNELAMASLYEKTKNLTAAVKDPRSQSVIRECWGQMFGDQGQWQRAYGEFYNAFSNYQEIGNREKAKRCLKYVVVANMLSGGKSNPFDAREAKVYQSDADIQSIGLLRTAYEKCDVDGFQRALRLVTDDGDAFVARHLSSMVADFHARAIVKIITSYRRVRIQFLAEQLDIKPSEVETMLVRLIVEGKVQGRIDQVRGLLDLSASQNADAAKYSAIHSWSRALDSLTSKMPSANPPSTSGAGGARGFMSTFMRSGF